MDEMKRPLLIKKGAEANLYVADWHGKRVVMKIRLPKKYRLSKIDEQIRTYRTIHEPQLMHEAKRAGVPTPTIFLVDVKNATIIMQFIEGKQAKEMLRAVSSRARRKMCFKIGVMIGKLHKSGIIHGDLTTSNMIQNPTGKIFFIDFGLGEKRNELEAKGVDLHLMKRALQSTHFQYFEESFNALIKGYSQISDAETVRNVLDKIKEIERRGRYTVERRVRG